MSIKTERRKRGRTLLAAVWLCLSLAGCSAATTEVPALLTPEGVLPDTAVVRRDDFYRIRQYRAFLRAHTEAVFFGETDLMIKNVAVRAGQEVKKGDLIAALDTEPLEKAIAEETEAIEHIKAVHAHENTMKQLDIDMANVRLRTAEENTRELMRIEVQKQTAALRYGRELQALALARQEKKLAELHEMLTLSVIAAPFDGVVVSVEPLWEGSPAVPFQPVAYVADTAHLFVEYSGTDSFMNDGEITAEIAGKSYELELVPLETEEQLKYALDGRVPPARLNLMGDPAGLVPGQFAAVYVKSDRQDDVLLVPVNAVYADSGEQGVYVYVMNEGVKEPRTVKSGPRNESEMVVLDGLLEGEEVFVKQ